MGLLGLYLLWANAPVARTSKIMVNSFFIWLDQWGKLLKNCQFDIGWTVPDGVGLSLGLEQGSALLVSSIFTANCAMAAMAVPAEINDVVRPAGMS